MIQYVVSVFLVLCASRTEAFCNSSPCITVDVYYESLCPDSVRFIVNQLATSYDGLKDHLDINLVPYGKAIHRRDENGKWLFSCQHGAAECRGNKAQACALNSILNSSDNFDNKQSLAISLVECVMSSSNAATAVPRCTVNVGLNPDMRKTINDCVESTDGDRLLVAHGDKTHSLNPPLTFVPTIVLDNVYSSANQNAALVNFKKLICGQIPAGAKPAVCRYY
ncbi:gamma-interferon-inducible lysosomal thiol reductase [Fopius arisanus]|uniref:Gamma-interferon-inducible lysosomal thiol reductase n=1 Tax=Fopius arisanus TaxID=64838 RepID=A0A0C9R684_9HYME|nr:PREDICTED: gamma-interferon-inducible lysosomal thiol reductase [Fopius arisanus]